MLFHVFSFNLGSFYHFVVLLLYVLELTLSRQISYLGVRYIEDPIDWETVMICFGKLHVFQRKGIDNRYSNLLLSMCLQF